MKKDNPRKKQKNWKCLWIFFHDWEFLKDAGLSFLVAGVSVRKVIQQCRKCRKYRTQFIENEQN